MVETNLIVNCILNHTVVEISKKKKHYKCQKFEINIALENQLAISRV